MTLPVGQKINREVILLLGWSRAILLQFAHPLVAQGVSDHTSVHTTPGGHARRLLHTLDAMLNLSFGSREEVLKSANIINRIHDRVHGQLTESAGKWTAGTPYSAHDWKLLAWVHATLLDSLLITYELYVGRLTPQEKDGFCLEASVMEDLLEMPSGVLPRGLRELEQYMDAMFSSGDLAVTATARRLAAEILRPGPWPLRPFFWLLHLPTRGLMPVPIREAYRIHWSRPEQMMLRSTAFLSRWLLPMLPSLIRHWPRAKRVWFPVLQFAERATG